MSSINRSVLEQDYHQNLAAKYEANQKKARELRTTIASLWERLEVDQNEREMFLLEKSGSYPSTIMAVCIIVTIARSFSLNNYYFLSLV